ncbi:hypothetical protein HOI18_05225 [Candidatus Uhrbacteria bacterium]|nr:hypothetical protein [Candidatus Uhrbacteria bacterium]
MSESQSKIEDLLEQIGTHEVHGDPEHRYELRRALLCSRYFDSPSCDKTSRWDIIFTYTAPLIAGGVAVGVFAFMATSFTAVQGQPFQEAAGEIELAIESPVYVEDAELLSRTFVPVAEFASDPTEPLVQLADFDTGVEQESSMLIPVSSNTPTMAR